MGDVVHIGTNLREMTSPPARGKVWCVRVNLTRGGIFNSKSPLWETDWFETSAPHTFFIEPLPSPNIFTGGISFQPIPTASPGTFMAITALGTREDTLASGLALKIDPESYHMEHGKIMANFHGIQESLRC